MNFPDIEVEGRADMASIIMAITLFTSIGGVLIFLLFLVSELQAAGVLGEEFSDATGMLAYGLLPFLILTLVEAVRTTVIKTVPEYAEVGSVATGATGVVAMIAAWPPATLPPEMMQPVIVVWVGITAAMIMFGATETVGRVVEDWLDGSDSAEVSE